MLVAEICHFPIEIISQVGMSILLSTSYSSLFFLLLMIFFPEEEELIIKQTKKMLARHFAHLQIPALRAITSQGYSLSSDTHSPLALYPLLLPLHVSNPEPFPQGFSITQQQASHSTGLAKTVYICFCLSLWLRPLPPPP